MKIFISIFFVLIIGILTSKIKINVISWKNIRIEFYLFGLIKIFSFKFKNKNMIKKESLKILKLSYISEILKKLNIKIETLKVDLKIGTEDIMITVFAVTFISTFLSILSAKNNNNYYYKITPIYNMNKFDLDISSKISVNTINFIKASKFMNEIKFLANNNVSKKTKESEKV